MSFLQFFYHIVFFILYFYLLIKNNYFSYFSTFLLFYIFIFFITFFLLLNFFFVSNFIWYFSLFNIYCSVDLAQVRQRHWVLFGKKEGSPGCIRVFPLHYFKVEFPYFLILTSLKKIFFLFSSLSFVLFSLYLFISFFVLLKC